MERDWKVIWELVGSGIGYMNVAERFAGEYFSVQRTVDGTRPVPEGMEFTLEFDDRIYLVRHVPEEIGLHPGCYRVLC